MSQTHNAYRTAREFCDYWEEFRADSHRLVLAKYKREKTDSRSRYSLFLLPDGQQQASICYNFEPEEPDELNNLIRDLDKETDPELKELLEMQIELLAEDPPLPPASFFGVTYSDGHGTIGEAPNDLTLEEFSPIALEWASSQLNIPVSKIVPLKVVEEPKRKGFSSFLKRMLYRSRSQGQKGDEDVNSGKKTPMSDFPAAVVCDRCSRKMTNGDGYVFYSTSSIDTLEMGLMLLCERCGTRVTNGEYWSEKIREVQSGMHNPTAEISSKSETINRMDVGIIALCIHLDLTPDTAKSKAKKMAKLYWRNPDKGADKIARKWTRGR